MLLEFAGVPCAAQGDLANAATRSVSCCADPSAAGCNRALSDGEITRLLSAQRLRGKYVDGAVSFGTLERELEAGRPVLVALTWAGGQGGHLVLVVGSDVNRFGPYVWINDPDPRRGFVSVYFNDLQSGLGRGKWDATWIGLRGAGDRAR
jgi:hypothetical protein